MFHFTLAEDVEEWFYSLPANRITTWEEMETEFLNEYFRTSAFLRKRYEILNFKQREDEPLGDAYKRFKRLLIAFLTHNLDQTEQMQMFINEHLELYDRCISKPKWIIDLKLLIKDINLDDQVIAKHRYSASSSSPNDTSNQL